MKLLPAAVLLIAGCTAADPAARPTSPVPGVYTPIGQVGRPLGAISTDCRIDDNGLGATCRKLDRMPEGPITPISAGQPRP